MSEALDMDSGTLAPVYQPPASMVEQESASAFNIDLPVEGRRRPTTRVLIADQRVRPLGDITVAEVRDVRAPAADQQDKTVTLTDLVVRFSDPSRALANELGEKAKRAQADVQAYKARIEVLRADAAQDGYGLNAVSEQDLWYFIRSEPFIRKGNLVLMDNGNLRSVWKGENGTYIGLQFLGGRTVQYVIFKRRTTTGAISRVAGRDSFDGVKRQILAFDLRPLIFA